MRLCWQKSFWAFDYGWDDELKTGIFKNPCSLHVYFKGYWMGIAW